VVAFKDVRQKWELVGLNAEVPKEKKNADPSARKRLVMTKKARCCCSIAGGVPRGVREGAEVEESGR